MGSRGLGKLHSAISLSFINTIELILKCRNRVNEAPLLVSSKESRKNRNVYATYHRES